MLSHDLCAWPLGAAFFSAGGTGNLVFIDNHRCRFKIITTGVDLHRVGCVTVRPLKKHTHTHKLAPEQYANMSRSWPMVEVAGEDHV